MNTLQRARLGPATILAVGFVVSAWPLGRLFEAAPWRGPLTAALIAVVVVGSLARARRLPPAATTLATLAAVLLVLLLWSAASTLAFGIVPTPETAARWSDLLAEGVTTVRSSPPPAPATAGVAFGIAATVALIAWAGDALAVTLDHPAIGALLLVTPFLVAVANSSGALPATYLALLATCWLLLLGVHGLSRARRWSTIGVTRTSAGVRLDRPGTAGAEAGRRVGPGGVGVAALVGAVTLAIGLLGPTMLPHLPVRYLADGLGRGQSGRVGFSPDVRLLSDLREGDRTPVLRYRSDDPEAPPLRASVATRLADGAWVPRPVGARPSEQPRLTYPSDLRPDIPRTTRRIEVLETRLAPPYLAAPQRVVEGSVSGAHWAMDRGTGVLVSDRTPASYELVYLTPEPDAARLAAIPPLPDRDRADLADALDEAAVTPDIRRAAADVTRGASGPYEEALAIQQWFRDAGRFTYTLDLPSRPRGVSEEAWRADALDRFLEDRRGYCVQFASAMTLMARARGIPARVASGFLPGTFEGDTRTVVAADAHAWPELYLTGVGWLRFEPTPGERSSRPPAYAVPGASAAPTPTDGTTTTPSVVTPTPDTQGRPERDPDAGAPAADPGAARSGGGGRWAGTLTALLLAAAVLLLTPAAALLAHRRRLSAAGTDAARVEAHWARLRSRLSDLGLRPPPGATLRDQHDWYRQAAVLGPEADRALRRVVAAVEDAWYAPPHPLPDIAEDTARVAAEAGDLRSRGVRLRAVLLPGAGLRALSAPARRLAREVRERREPHGPPAT